MWSLDLPFIFTWKECWCSWNFSFSAKAHWNKWVSDKYLVLRLGYEKQPLNHPPKPFSFNMILKPFETNWTRRLPPLTIFRQPWLDPVMMHKEFEVFDHCSVNVSIIFSFLIYWQVSEMAVSELPGNPNAVWTVRRHVEGNTNCALLCTVQCF